MGRTQIKICDAWEYIFDNGLDSITIFFFFFLINLLKELQLFNGWLFGLLYPKFSSLKYIYIIIIIN